MSKESLSPLMALVASLALIACDTASVNDAGPSGDSGVTSTDGGRNDAGGASMDAGDGTEDAGPGGSDAGPGDAGDGDAGDGPTDSGTAFAGVRPSGRTMGANGGFSTAVDDSDLLWTWGSNRQGQLGTDTIAITPPFEGRAFTPVRPLGLESVTVAAVAVGAAHVLLLDDAGGLWAWGDNDGGQVGNDDAGTDARAPVRVAMPTGVTAIGVGDQTSFAIDADGDLWAWGENGVGQLGDGTMTDRPTPVEISPPPGRTFAAVDGASNVTVAITDDGDIWAWGAGSPTPARLDSRSRAVAIAVGGGHTVYLDDAGVLRAWGANGDGQLGDGTTTDSPTPVEIDLSGFSSPVAAIRAGGNSSFAILEDGTVLGWGDNEHGQLGLTGGDVSTPTLVTTPVAVDDLAVGDEHTVARGTDGRFFAWGSNADGKLGDGTGTPRSEPMPTRGPSGAVPAAVHAATANFSFILMDDGELWRAGQGRRASGGGANDASPLYVVRADPLDIEMVATAETHTLILDTMGRVWAMGDNGSGQLGTGDTTGVDDPVEVPFTLDAGRRIVWIGVHEGSSAALDDGGQLWMWGDNRRGQIGDGTTTQRTRPVRSMANVRQASIGSDYALAVDNSGFAWSWGLASQGRGGATPATRCPTSPCNPTPVRVCDVGTDVSTCSGLMQWLGVVDEVSAGTQTSLIRMGDRVLCMGRNNKGQCGDGTWQGSGGREVPQFVEEATSMGPLTGITRVWAGSQSMYALHTDGRLFAWGANGLSELGVETGMVPSACATGTPCRLRAAPVAALAGIAVSQLSVGSSHVLLLDATTGTAWSWGNNNDGELGHFARDSAGFAGDVSYVPRAITFIPR